MKLTELKENNMLNVEFSSSVELEVAKRLKFLKEFLDVLNSTDANEDDATGENLLKKRKIIKEVLSLQLNIINAYSEDFVTRNEKFSKPNNGGDSFHSKSDRIVPPLCGDYLCDPKEQKDKSKTDNTIPTEMFTLGRRSKLASETLNEASKYKGHACTPAKDAKWHLGEVEVGTDNKDNSLHQITTFHNTESIWPNTKPRASFRNKSGENINTIDNEPRARRGRNMSVDELNASFKEDAKKLREAANPGHKPIRDWTTIADLIDGTEVIDPAKKDIRRNNIDIMIDTLKEKGYKIIEPEVNEESIRKGRIVTRKTFDTDLKKLDNSAKLDSVGVDEEGKIDIAYNKEQRAEIRDGTYAYLEEDTRYSHMNIKEIGLNLGVIKKENESEKELSGTEGHTVSGHKYYLDKIISKLENKGYDASKHNVNWIKVESKNETTQESKGNSINDRQDCLDEVLSSLDYSKGYVELGSEVISKMEEKGYIKSAEVKSEKAKYEVGQVLVLVASDRDFKLDSLDPEKVRGLNVRIIKSYKNEEYKLFSKMKDQSDYYLVEILPGTSNTLGKKTFLVSESNLRPVGVTLTSTPSETESVFYKMWKESGKCSMSCSGESNEPSRTRGPASKESLKADRKRLYESVKRYPKDYGVEDDLYPDAYLKEEKFSSCSGPTISINLEDPTIDTVSEKEKVKKLTPDKEAILDTKRNEPTTEAKGWPISLELTKKELNKSIKKQTKDRKWVEEICKRNAKGMFSKVISNPITEAKESGYDVPKQVKTFGKRNVTKNGAVTGFNRNKKNRKAK